MISRLVISLLLSVMVVLLIAQIDVHRENLGKIKDSRLGELSGMVASAKHPNRFWTHNDSGDSARIFLIDDHAQLKGIYYLEGVAMLDMEDIALYKDNGTTFLVLADIGDNLGKRKNICLYIVEEPDWKEGESIYIIPKKNIRKIIMYYEDRPRDAEAIFVDPLDLTCYLVSKRDFHVGLYPIWLSNQDSSITLKRSMSLPLTFVTAADMSSDGQYIIMKNLTNVFLWKRGKQQSVLALLKSKYEKLPYQMEPQGESICFGQQNSVFYTISERPLGLDAYLYRYNILSLN